MFCSGLASYGCRRSSIPAIVPIVRSRGSTSVLIENFAQGWQIRSLASFTGSAYLVKIEKLGLLFVMHHPSFLHCRIRVWVRFTTYDFVCCSACVQARPSRVSSFEHPRCNWVEAVCRFYSVIIPVAGVDIQRGGIGTGLALCVLQVCGLPLHSIPLLFMLLRLMSVPALLYSCAGFGLTSLCFCLSPCNICVKLNLDLHLDMVVDRRVFEIDSYGVLHLNIKVEGLSYASPVAFLLGYWFCCWNIFWAR